MGRRDGGEEMEERSWRKRGDREYLNPISFFLPLEGAFLLLM